MWVCNGLCNQSKLYHDDRSSHKNAPGSEGVDKIMESLHIDQKFIRYETYKMIWNKFSFMNSKAHDPGSYSLNIHYILWHRSAFFICPNKSRKYRINQCYICYYIFIPNKENILFVVDVWMIDEYSRVYPKDDPNKKEYIICLLC